MYVVNSLRRAAQIAPDRIASVHEGRSWTWSQVEDRVARLARVLRESGIQPGDRVALLGWNSDRYLEAVLAVSWARAVIVPLNTRLVGPEIAFQLDHAGAGALIYDSGFEPLVGAIAGGLPSLRTPICMGEVGHTPSGAGNFDALIAGAARLDEAAPEPGELIGIFYTGGTTGLPKGVMVTHANIAHQTGLHLLDLGWTPATTYLHVLPMFHLGGLLCAYCLTALAGSQHYMAKFEIEAFLERVAAERIDAAALGPVIIGWLLDHPRLAEFDLSALEHMAYGTSPIPEPVLRKAMEKLPHVRFTQIYGQTEISGTIAVLRPDEHALEGATAGRLRSAGRASWGVHARIVDEAGAEVARYALGEIVARSPGVMSGYWRDEAQTADTVRAGWLHSGDVGYMDEEGFIYVVDRKKHMIVSGGENVFSSEVERAIAAFPGVAQVAVIGIPHDTWGEAVHAVVVPVAGAVLTEEGVMAHCHTLIAGYKCPKSVEIRSGTLPLSGVNKIQKHVLREPYWAGRSRNIN